MIIVAFSKKTSKIMPRILCRGWRHVAVITGAGCHGDMTLHQFVRRNNIAKIKLQSRDLNILRANGWRFIYIAIDARDDIRAHNAITCVGYAKRRLGIRNIRIQTPTQLYNYLK